jgi:hypothetical protein
MAEPIAFAIKTLVAAIAICFLISTAPLRNARRYVFAGRFLVSYAISRFVILD